MKAEDRLKEFYRCECPSHVHEVGCACGCKGQEVINPATEAIALLRESQGLHAKQHTMNAKQWSRAITDWIRRRDKYLDGGDE